MWFPTLKLSPFHCTKTQLKEFLLSILTNKSKNGSQFQTHWEI